MRFTAYSELPKLCPIEAAFLLAVLSVTLAIPSSQSSAPLKPFNHFSALDPMPYSELPKLGPIEARDQTSHAAKRNLFRAPKARPH